LRTVDELIIAVNTPIFQSIATNNNTDAHIEHAVVSPSPTSKSGVGLRLVDGDGQWRIQVPSPLPRKFLNFNSKMVHFVHFYALILKFAGFLYMQKITTETVSNHIRKTVTKSILYMFSFRGKKHQVVLR